MIVKKNVKLVIPSEQYLYGYLDACREYKANGNWIFNVHNPDTFEDWKTSLFSKRYWFDTPL